MTQTTTHPHTHTIPYAPLDTILDKLNEVKAAARDTEQLALYNLVKIVSQIACIAYMAPDNTEKKGPAIYSVPATAPGTPLAAQLHPPAKPTAAPQPQYIAATAQQTAELAAGKYAHKPKATDTTLTFTLRLTLERPMTETDMSNLREMVAGRAWVMNNVKFAEIL